VKAPLEGEVWVEKRILPALKLNLGDELHIGEKALKISKILTYEPDRQGDFYSMSARVMMNERDLAQANVIQAGRGVSTLWITPKRICKIASF
jgi:putative ABC transport system permease protein